MANDKNDISTGASEGFEKSSYLELDIEDEALVKRIDDMISGSRGKYNEIKKRAERNEKYWQGDQIDEDKLQDFKNKVVSNLIFRNMETIIPIITANTPDPSVIHSNKAYARQLKDLLIHRFDVIDEMLKKSRIVLRHKSLWFLGALKYRFNPDIEYNGELEWSWVLPENIIVDHKATSKYDCRFVAEYIGHETVSEVIERYPDSKADLLKKLGAKGGKDEEILGGKLTYVEFNTPEWTVWKYKDVVFDKQKNPNWNWPDEDNEELEKINILKKPTVPYIFLSGFNLGRGMHSNTTVVEQSIKLQDLYNKRKRQIADNADLASGTLVASGEGIKKEEFAKFEGAPDERLWISQGRPSDVIDRVVGNPLQEYTFDDMQHTGLLIDDIMGTHGPTRGAGSERGQTATETVLQKRQDYTRLDDLIRGYEDFIEDYYEACLQMMLIHFDGDHRYPTEDGDDIIVSKEMIEKELSKAVVKKESETQGVIEEEKQDKFVAPIVLVKKGSTLPIDEFAQRNEAVELWARNGINPIDLYDKLGWSDPHRSAQRLYVWEAIRTGQLPPQFMFPELTPPGEPEISQGVIDDVQAISEGEAPGPNPEVENPETAEAHIRGHQTFIESDEFEGMDPPTQKALVEHTRGELEIAKQLVQQ